MSRWMIILLALLALPYGYLVLYWGNCLVSGCRFNGHMLFYSFIALLAIPFVMVTIGGGVMMGGARRARRGEPPSTAAACPVKDGARVRGQFWTGLALLLTALPTGAALLYLILYTPEQGRDMLGRICETKGSSTTCRPDPDAERPSELDRANREMQRKKWFEKD